MWCGSASMATACARWLAEVEVLGMTTMSSMTWKWRRSASGSKPISVPAGTRTLVDDGALYAAVPANVDGFVQDAPLDLGEAVDADARAEHALVDVAARHDAAFTDQRVCRKPTRRWPPGPSSLKTNLAGGSDRTRYAAASVGYRG